MIYSKVNKLVITANDRFGFFVRRGYLTDRLGESDIG